jgi:hypothetical protein
VTDAEVPCPVCGGEAWEVVEVRSEPEEEYTRWRLLVCGSCTTIAHRWSSGRRRKNAAVDPELERHLEAWRQEDRCAFDAPKVIARAGFAVYRLERSLVHTARIASHSSEDGRLRSVTVEHRARTGRATTAVKVRSSIDDPWSHRPGPVPTKIIARHALAHAINGAVVGDEEFSRRDLSFEAQLLHHDHRVRVAPGQERAERAEITDRSIPIDGTQVKVTIARDESGLWVAVTMINRRRHRPSRRVRPLATSPCGDHRAGSLLRLTPTLPLGA